MGSVEVAEVDGGGAGLAVRPSEAPIVEVNFLILTIAEELDTR
jgi:hypothetical protein